MRPKKKAGNRSFAFSIYVDALTPNEALQCCHVLHLTTLMYTPTQRKHPTLFLKAHRIFISISDEEGVRSV